MILCLYEWQLLELWFITAILPVSSWDTGSLALGGALAAVA